MKHARIVNNSAVDVRTESPEGFFTPDIVAEFVEVPDEVENGWTLENGTWSAPPEPEPTPEPAPAPEPAVTYPQVSPVQFKLLFTPQERVAINAARATDPVIDDFYDIIEDPRLTYVDLALQSVQDAVVYLANQSLIAPERVPEILSGQLV